MSLAVCSQQGDAFFGPEIEAGIIGRAVTNTIYGHENLDSYKNVRIKLVEVG